MHSEMAVELVDSVIVVQSVAVQFVAVQLVVNSMYFLFHIIHPSLI